MTLPLLKLTLHALPAPSATDEPDPKYETLAKLKGFFQGVANKLLIVKKQQLELKMKQDLNINLAAYQDVISKVELSENRLKTPELTPKNPKSF